MATTRRGGDGPTAKQGAGADRPAFSVTTLIAVTLPSDRIIHLPERDAPRVMNRLGDI